MQPGRSGPSHPESSPSRTPRPGIRPADARHPGAAGRGALARGVLCSLLILLAFVGPPLLAAETTAWLQAASGTVAVARADGSAVQPARPGTTLGPGDRIATVGRSSATLDLPGLGQIDLGADSTIVLRELRWDGADLVLVAEIVHGMTVHRLSPASGTRIGYRIVDPSGLAVAQGVGSASFGVGRDENGHVTVACERCPTGTLSFPAAGQWLTSGRARTLTARGEVVEASLGGSIYDALASGASADDDGSTTPSTARLPEGQRTGSRDDRRRIDNDDDALSSSAATATPTPTVPATTPTPTPTQAPRAVEATIANFVYLPDPIQIRVGQTVRWTNLDPDIHTVTATDQSWTSPILTQGQTYQRTFTQTGTFPYFCEPHPFMQGVVEVSP